MGGPIMGQKNAAREVDAESADDCTDSSTARAHIAHNGHFHSARELRNKICQKQTPRSGRNPSHYTAGRLANGSRSHPQQLAALTAGQLLALAFQSA
jgi:hypothetical protein